MNSIIINNISKNYDKVTALTDISLEVEEGSIFGLIGPDGAGKTSLIRILTTLILADSGTATLNNLDVVKDYKKIRQIIGYMPGKFSLYQDLTVEENINLFAKIFGTTVQKNYHLIKDIYSQIEPYKKRLAGQLSGGMKQKLALSCALIHKPEFLFLDEPTTGVDPVSRKELWEMLTLLKKENITIFVSTAYMDEAGLCDKVALIQDGNILGVNTVDGIISNFNKKLYAVKGNNIYKILNDLKSYKQTHRVYPFGETVHLVIDTKESIKEDIQKYIKSKDNTDIIIDEVKPTVEDCFIDLMGANNEN